MHLHRLVQLVVLNQQSKSDPNPPRDLRAIEREATVITYALYLLWMIGKGLWGLHEAVAPDEKNQVVLWWWWRLWWLW